MLGKRLLTSLIIVLASVEGVHAQVSLGTPLPTDFNARPILGPIGRTVFTPFLRTPQYTIMEPSVPMPTREELARMIVDGGFTPAEITAARIKIEESQAKTRQAAVRYLATVDCHYYPEAEMSLIAALRADRNEGVRYEAAVCLGNCRGTTRRIIDALTVSALGHETDGNPSENSERVRLAARNSLSQALANGMALFQNQDPSQAVPPMFAMQPTTFTLPTSNVSPRERELAETVSATAKTQTTHSGPRTLIEWFQNLTGSRSQGSSFQGVDPRLRGVSFLGSESTLAIPASHANPVQRASWPYNGD